jgi:hypothetical protein
MFAQCFGKNGTRKFARKFFGALAETLEIIKWNLKEGLLNLRQNAQRT